MTNPLPDSPPARTLTSTQVSLKRACWALGSAKKLSPTEQTLRLQLLRVLRVLPDDLRAALEEWRRCSSPRLTWTAGGHCAHCEPLRRILANLDEVVR